MVLSVFVFEELEPVGGDLSEVRQVAVYLLDLGFQTCHQLVGFVLIELQDTLHLDFEQFQDVVLRHLTYQSGIVGCQTFVDMLTDGIDGGCLFEFLVFIDALLDEDLLQRLEVELFQELVLADLKFLTDEVLRAVHTVAQHITDGEELRFVILDHTTVR